MNSESHKPTVLVVEDEPILLDLAVDILAESGFVAIPACDATEALQMLEKRRDVSVVFTDVNMPGSIDGLTLARSIHRRWPLIDIVVTSGRAPIDLEDLPAQGCFLPKPYAPETLIKTLRQLVNADC